MNDRVILHSDLNGFYAAVECFQNPQIRHLPVAVCGDASARHGIVLAKNEIAKKYGIRTGHVIWEAKQLCPNIVILPANFPQYARFSNLAKSIYVRYTDRVESFGIDECWLDVTGSDGKKVADEIREAIKRELGITVSVGVSWNKIYAKLGSDIKKPDATTVISRENYKQTIFKLPANSLLLVGKATVARLNKYGVFTIGELANSDVKFLKQKFGKCGEHIWSYANGLDNSPVAHYYDDTAEKSVGNSMTTYRDLKTVIDVKMAVSVLADSVASRMREGDVKGNVIHLGIRDNNLQWWGKQTSVKRPTFISREIIEAAMSLFDFYDFSRPIRSVAVKVSGIRPASSPVQTDMFTAESRRNAQEKLEFVTDDIRARYGHCAISRGRPPPDRS